MASMQRKQAHAKQYALQDGGKSVGISVGASMLVASVAGCVNVMLTNPIWCAAGRQWCCGRVAQACKDRAAHAGDACAA